MRTARQEKVRYAIEDIIRGLKKKKAVLDRIPNEAVKKIWKAIEHRVLEVFQECWLDTQKRRQFEAGKFSPHFR